MYKQKRMVTASGSEIMCPCATPLGTYFPEGNLVTCIVVFVTPVQKY